MQKAVRDAFARGVLADMAKTGFRQRPAQIAVKVYRNEVPSFAAVEMDRLYGTLYSSSAYLQASGSSGNIHTYVARRGGKISAIFLFMFEGGTVRVVNEGMQLMSEEICRFAQHMFNEYETVGAVSFHAVQTEQQAIPFVHQRFFCAEDFIAPLPDTPAAYLASLGSATRKNIKRHKNRIERDFPSFQHRLYEGRDVDEQDLLAIIELNRVRMASKHKASFINEVAMQEIIRLVRTCGEVCIATIDGRLCAGTIIFRVGGSHISRVHAHDPRYDAYRLGMVCCYLAVCACIERGGSRFHFGHGRYEYKSALLGRRQEFDHLTLYRSSWHRMKHARMAVKIAAAGYRLRASRWVVQGAEQGSNALWRGLGKALAAWRKFRQRRAAG